MKEILKKIIIFLIPTLSFTIGALVWSIYSGTIIDSASNDSSEQFTCTQEAKLCPDGSSVGRSGPNCEFAACPNVQEQISQIPSDWLTYIDTAQGISFKYPKNLSTTYISTQEWPPKITISNEDFSCNETPPTSSLPNRVIERTVDNHKTYCVTANSEGAAGSVYNAYTYSTEMDGKLLTGNFILRFTQCSNYPSEQEKLCSGERETFDLDSVIDRILQSVALN